MLSKSAVKYIQSLQQKKQRDEHSLFVAEGPKVVGELLRESAFACRQIFALSDWDGNGMPAPAEKVIITDEELGRISGMQTPNRVLAVFEMRPPVRPRVSGDFSLVLDGIQDPGNLGTIIRTADWFGVKNIVCSEDTADMYNPKVVQSSMASLARVNIYYTDISEWLMEQHSVRKLAAALSGNDLHAVNKSGEGILIIGNESAGIRPAIMELADEKVRIPGSGQAESLNAGVAAGILMYALLG
jgi:TrmH family RNA methyltransferase